MYFSFFEKKKKKKWRKKKISCVLKKSKAQQKKKTQMYLWPCKTNEHIILHVGTNGLHSEETTSEIANSIIEIANSSKNEANTIHVSLIDPRNDNLDNKVNDANSCLTKMSRTFYVVKIDVNLIIVNFPNFGTCFISIIMKI